MSLVADNSLVHQLRMIAAVELHVNATYTQHPALKSVYENKPISCQQWVVSQLFSSCRTVFELAQSAWGFLE